MHPSSFKQLQYASHRSREVNARRDIISRRIILGIAADVNVIRILSKRKKTHKENVSTNLVNADPIYEHDCRKGEMVQVYISKVRRHPEICQDILHIKNM